jgi:hypothetical protein
MTTWYVDYDGGTDAAASIGAGDSFATRRKKIDNIVYAVIAPGDSVRVMASPTPTLLGNATWTDGPLAANLSIASSTNAAPIVITSAAAHGMVTGDTVIITSHATNTRANGVWTVTSLTSNSFSLDGSVGNGVGGYTGGYRKFTNAVVTLAAPCTANVACFGNRDVSSRANWVASADVTCTVVANPFKEGFGSQQVAIAAGFTTGLAAYFPTGALDLSAYQQLSFWAYQTVGTLGAAGSISIKLCSDTVGLVPVNSFDIPYIGSLWKASPIVVDTGGALGASIQSIAIYVNTDNGAQTFQFDNFIACKAASAADSLNLTSLISKDPGDHTFGDGYECWFGIQSINGTRVVLEGVTDTCVGTVPQRGYAGTTETVATYKRETTKTVMRPAASNSPAQQLTKSGTAGNLITYSGGWNRTDMSTQTGETWFDGQNGHGSGMYTYNAATSWLSFDKLNFTRYHYGFDCSGYSGFDISIGRMEFCNTTNYSVNAVSCWRLSANVLSAVCCGGAIATGPEAIIQNIGRADSTSNGAGATLAVTGWTGTIFQANNNLSTGVYVNEGGYVASVNKANGNGSRGIHTYARSVVGYVNANNNMYYGIDLGIESRILSGVTSGNGISGVVMSVSGGYGYLRNMVINEASEVPALSSPYDRRIYSEKHDGVSGDTQIFCDGGRISLQAAIVHGAATAAWKFSPTNTDRRENYPLNLPIAQIAVAANALVTVTAWFRRSNTALTSKLVCKGGQLAGVASDVTASMTAAADTWEQLTLTFTPTEAGVIEIEAQFYGGTTYNGYVSDATFTQA